MTNEERILRWRERREAEEAARAAFPALDPDLAIIALSGRSLAETDDASHDVYLDTVLDGLRQIAHVDQEEQPLFFPDRVGAGERRRVYEALAKGVASAPRERESVPGRIDLCGRKLRALVRLVETELREGRDIFADGYRPADLDATLDRLDVSFARQHEKAIREATRLARREAVRRGEAFAVPVMQQDQADLSFIRERLHAIDASRGVSAADLNRPTLSTMLALARFQLQALQAESRFALLYMFVGPAVLLSIILSLYLLNGADTVLNMNVATFAMIGATSWIMFRNVIFRSSGAVFSARSLLNLHAVSPVLLGIVQGTIYYLAYNVVFLVLILAGAWIGIFTLPVDWIGFAGWVAAMGLAGLTVGVIFGSIAMVWPFFLRTAPVIERALQIFSGVFFVSDQLPVEFRQYVLWSPFMHALELMRADYFGSYEPADANPQYFALCLGVLVCIAFAAERSLRSRSHPM